MQPLLDKKKPARLSPSGLVILERRSSRCGPTNNQNIHQLTKDVLIMEASSDRVNTPADNIPSIQGHTVSASLDFAEAMDGAMEEGKKKAEEARVWREQKRAEDEAAAAEVRATESDIIQRARKLFTSLKIQFPEIKKVHNGDSFVTRPTAADRNRLYVLNVLFDEDENRPHFDEFRGRIVDHEGKIIDDHYPVSKWIEAFAAAGLTGEAVVSATEARKILRENALDHRWNDLIRRMDSKVLAWDGIPRIRRALIDWLACNDVELNEDISEYFFLSLYNRVTNPGCDASIVLCLFGAQHSGKSYMQKRICRLITGNNGADTVRLNMELKDAGTKDFLRKITGKSVIASGSEMTGFSRGDMSNIKDFVARTVDSLDFKYEGHIEQQRQWILVMDGNEYHGLQRDKTGNRRFYPMFVGQLADRDGQPQWHGKGYKAPFLSDLAKFDEDFWQIMAECHAWLSKRGQEGYQAMLDDVAAKVTRFNQYEMDNMRGTSRNSVLDVHFMPVLRTLLDCTDKNAYPLKWTRYYDGPAYPNGVMVSAALFGELYKKHAEDKGVTYGHLDSYAQKFGASIVKGKANKRHYVFTAFRSIDEMIEAMESDDGLPQVEVVRGNSDDSEGF